MSDKAATVRISVGTNPNFTERYFVDLRDTTGGVTRRQVHTWHLDADGVRELLAKLRPQAAHHGVKLTVEDSTGEIVTPGCDGGQWCRCPKSTPCY